MNTALRHGRRVRVHRIRPTSRDRRGTAAVELALAMPLLFTLLFGVVEIGRALEVSHILTMAVREGGRFGATDKTGYVPDGSTANAKIVDDVRTFLIASGIPSSSLAIECVTIPDSPETAPVAFNFEDPANHMILFQINVSIPFSDVSYCPPPLQKYFSPTQTMTTSAVFRNYHK